MEIVAASCLLPVAETSATAGGKKTEDIRQRIGGHEHAGVEMMHLPFRKTAKMMHISLVRAIETMLIDVIQNM